MTNISGNTSINTAPLLNNTSYIEPGISKKLKVAAFAALKLISQVFEKLSVVGAVISFSFSAFCSVALFDSGKYTFFQKLATGIAQHALGYTTLFGIAGLTCLMTYKILHEINNN